MRWAQPLGSARPQARWFVRRPGSQPPPRKSPTKGSPAALPWQSPFSGSPNASWVQHTLYTKRGDRARYAEGARYRFVSQHGDPLRGAPPGNVLASTPMLAIRTPAQLGGLHENLDRWS